MVSTLVVATIKQQEKRNLVRFCYICCLIVLAALTLLVAISVPTAKDTSNFGTLWASGRAAAHGLDPYAAYPETHREDWSRSGGPSRAPDLNLNPPVTIPLFQLLSYLPLKRFIAVWAAGTWLCLALGMTLIFIGRPLIQLRQMIWLSLSMPTLFTLAFGQIYGHLFLVAALALVFYERDNELATAIMIGMLVAIRPTMAFWPVFLYLASYRRVAIKAVGVAAALYTLPLPFYGTLIYRQWFYTLQNDAHWMSRANIGFTAFAHRMGYRPIGIILAVAAAGACAIWIHRSKADFISASGAALCIGIISAPVGWVPYVIFAAPFFVARRWGGVATAAALAFFVPAPLLGSLWGPAFLLAVMAILCIFCSQMHRNPHSVAIRKSSQIC